MKTCKVKDQEEVVKNAKLFYEAVKLAWGLQVTYCYHDLIHMIKMTCAMIYMIVTMGLGAKNQNGADVCTLAEILKEEDDDEDEESEEKEEEEEKKNNDNETEATDEILKIIINEFPKYYIFLYF